MKDSNLYRLIDKMPKGGIHNLHLVGAAPPEFLLKLTYDDNVYFSERDKYFRISRVN